MSLRLEGFPDLLRAEREVSTRLCVSVFYTLLNSCVFLPFGK